jgi:uncharacterized protein YndB with AHSA1/START domain
VVGDDHVLGDVDQPAGQVAAVGRLQRRVRQALARAVGRDEVLHREVRPAWYPGEAVGTVVFAEQGGKTTVTQTLRYASPEARDGVLKSGMERGVAASYDRLKSVLAEMAAR